MKRIARALLILVFGLVLLVALGIRRDRPAAEVEARRGGPPSRFATVAGLRTHYRDRGQGQVIVLLHGSNSSLLTWEGWSAELAKSYRVVSLDLPGCGLTGPDPQQRYSAAQMAQFVDAFVTQLGVPRFTLAGNSMGGSVAWHYALAYGDKLERLILVDAAGYPREERRAFAMWMQSTPGLSRIARYVTPRFLFKKSLREVYGDPARLTEERIDEYMDMNLREGNREASRLRMTGHRDDGLSARMAEIKVPTLILWGGRDRWILPKYGERFHRDIAGSQLVTFADLGHIPMEEDPAQSLAPVLAFLE